MEEKSGYDISRIWPPIVRTTGIALGQAGPAHQGSRQASLNPLRPPITHMR